MNWFQIFSIVQIFQFSAFSAATDEHILNFKLIDNVPKGTLIGNIIQRLNVKLPVGPYRIIIGSSTFPKFQEYFTLSTIGDITTNLHIDRDNIGEICGPLNCCHKLVCDFYANIIFTYYLTKNVINFKIYFEIEDENDNSPRFYEPKFVINILEGGKSNRISLPTAHDMDSSSNGVYNYSLSGDGKGKFELSIKNGYPELILLSQLDFENKEERVFHMILAAYDSGGKYETMNLVIYTVDINDNTPLFDCQMYNVSVKENTTYKTPIITVIATDKDSGDNGAIFYKFNFLSSMDIVNRFFLNETSGDIFLLKKLDYEIYSEQVIEIKIEALDKGVPQQSSSTKIIIRTKDINDNYPIIEVLKNNSILENKQINTPVLSLYIHDDDTVENKVKCYKISGENFRLDSPQDQSIMVYTDTVYDFENVTLITLQIRCFDSGIPPLTTEKTLQIAIIDENDNVPIFQKERQQYEVLEDAKIGQFLFEIQAVDRDSGKYGELTYRLDMEGEKYFEINKTTAGVFINNNLDRETNSAWTFLVFATDGGGTESSTKVSVIVIDVNDNPPKLKSKKQLSVMENAENNTFVGGLETYDPDDGENARVQVDIDSEENKLFHLYLKYTGNKFFVRHPIDREKVSHIYIKLKLIDCGRPKLTTWETVTVLVIDQNDNDPTLAYPSQGEIVTSTALVFVNSNFKSHVLTLQGKDVDFEENGKVYYRIMDNCNGSRYFMVNESTGGISTLWSCRNEKYLSCPIPGIYRINVELKDGNPSPRTNRNYFFIKIHEFSDSYNLKESGNSNFKNVVILVMVVIFSLVLAVGLVGAIVWARNRPINQFANCANAASNNFKKSGKFNQNIYDPRFFSPDTEVEAHFLTIEKSNFTSGAPPHDMVMQKLCSPVSENCGISHDLKNYNILSYSPLNIAPSGFSTPFQQRLGTDGPSYHSHFDRCRSYGPFYPSSCEVMDSDEQSQKINERRENNKRDIPDFLKDSKYSKDSWYSEYYYTRDSGHGTNDDSNYLSCVD